MDSDSDGAGRPRQLIVCCDGTNNTLTAGAADTNVLRLSAHLARHPSLRRLVYYDPGVGTADAAPPTGPLDWTQRTWDRVSGLASGRGVYENIGLAYLFLMRNWRGEHDLIYCFGFSRGAFTARCVAGMVNLFGIIEARHDVMIPTLIHIYFSQPTPAKGAAQTATTALHRVLRGSRAALGRSAVPDQPDAVGERERLALQVRELFTTPAGHDACVHWVGVWDTVESVGLPGPLARTNPSSASLRGKRIRNVRHALSFDEHRWTFEPRLYDEPGDIEAGEAGQTLKQRWFSGVHCDAGGGYAAAQAQLSDEALQWMVAEVADDLGIPALEAPGEHRLRHDALWETPWWALAGMCLRNMQPRTSEHQAIAVVPGPWAGVVSTSVWDQRRQAWPIVLAVLAGAAFLLLSGICLTAGGWHALSEQGLGTAARQAVSFASDQFASLWGDGLLAAGAAPWDMSTQPAWAMLWDCLFILSWGYVLARISSLSFAWLAGARSPASSLPPWRLLGFAPLLAVGGDFGEDMLTLAAIVNHAAGVDLAASALLWLVGVASLAKLAGLVACVPLVLLRVWIAMPWVRRSRG